MASLASSAARDIPKAPASMRDNFTAVADRGDSVTATRPHSLPTPPNSISPALAAHGLGAQLQKAKLEPVNSDLDLHDVAATNASSAGPSPAAQDASGTITSSTLAKCHLPDILLDHGPLAIRHIMGYLTMSVPGFSMIPPTKARRLVVGALEGRGAGAGSEGPSLESDVNFEKVGWGRWRARRRGCLNSRHRRGISPASYGAAMPIARACPRMRERSRPVTPGSFEDDFTHSSQDDHDMHMMETEVDKMSMDGSASASCSEVPDDDAAVNDNPDDVTDDEDWAAVGAAALRAESYPSMTAAQSHASLRPPGPFLPGGFRSFSFNSGMAYPPPQPDSLDLAAFHGTPDAQEREAVEALLRLGSV